MKILYLRNFAKEMNLDHYNSQEIGLCKEFIDSGYDCDIIFYTKGIEKNESVYHKDGKTLNIKTKKAIKIFSNAIYLSLLSKFNEYDIIITSEFHQVMSMILPMFKKKNIFIYHGTYMDENPLIKYIPKFVIRSMNKKYKVIFAKSALAEKYLQQKGFDKVQTVGVGLDKEKIDSLQLQISDDISKIKDEKYMLYVGEFCERKNTLFLIEVLSKIKARDHKLYLIGNSTATYRILLENRIKELSLEERVVFVGKIAQSELAEYYRNAELFLLPSQYEIFGMVLLECIYFNTPIVSSLNGGSITLFKDNLEQFVPDDIVSGQWVDKIDTILMMDHFKRTQQYKAFYDSIIEKTSWNYISRLMTVHFER